MVTLAGDLTIQNIAGAHARLREAFAAGGPVRVDVAPDASVDLTLAQLLESARRTATDNGVDFALAAPAAGAFLETLNRGGFTETAEQRAFWLAQSGEA
ncbi:STAS domain-containing protein [Caulobacter sp. KR2-114]|uniref:STAS domain-containing protein n=1 Tax=Caulobacter sp. KR2-114 TaxID=3400912 RepID=UPI003BFDA42F